MNAPSRSDFLPIPLSRDPLSQDQSDDRMDQIRELLFGELQKQNDARFVELTLRLREVETVFSRRLDAMQVRLDALAGELNAEQRASFDELSRGVQDLGDRIRRIARD